MWTNAAAVRRRQRDVPDAAGRLAVLALAGGQDDPVAPVRRSRRTTWNQPSASRHVEQRRRRAATRRRCRGCRSPATTSIAPVATSTRAIWDASRSSAVGCAMTAIRAPSGDQAKASTSMPAGRSARSARAAAARVAGRPRRGTGASISQTWVQPRRRDRNARRRPSGDQRGSRPPPGLADDPGQARPVGLDDPDLVVADEGEPPTVGRPLRVADRLLRRGELGRDGPPPRARA